LELSFRHLGRCIHAVFAVSSAASVLWQILWITIPANSFPLKYGLDGNLIQIVTKANRLKFT
jgi:hypothetical protein